MAPNVDYIRGAHHTAMSDPHHMFWAKYRVCSEVSAWCNEQFGSSRLYHPEKDHVVMRGGRWWEEGRTFIIYDDADATAFRMRWC